MDYLYDKVGLYDATRAVIEGEAPADSIAASTEGVSVAGPRVQTILVGFVSTATGSLCVFIG